MRKVFVLGLFFVMPMSAFAVETTTAPSAQGIASLADFYDLIRVAAGWLVVFGILIGALFIIWGGVQYATSGGDEDKTGEGKKKIIAGLIGIALVLLAYAVVNIVGSFLGAPNLVS